MNEIQTDTFDYSLVDKATSDYLKEKEAVMKEIVNNASENLGKELYEAQQRLAKNGYGCFEEWYTALGFKTTNVYHYINRYSFLQQLKEQKDIETFQELPVRVQNEMSKKSAKKEVNQAVFDGDIKTHKEYKEMERKLKQAETQAETERKERERLERENEELANREPEKIEVIPDDYDKLKGGYKAVERLRDRYKKENEQLRRELKELESEINKNKIIGDEIDYERKEKEVKLLQLDASKSVLKTKISIDEFLQEVAVTSYRRGAIAASSEGTKNKLREGIDDLKNFIKEMELALDGTIEQ